MRYRHILFDFDGTIVDSGIAGIGVINALAPEFGYPPVADGEIESLRHFSARDLLKRRLGIQMWRVFTALRFEKRFREELAKNPEATKLVPGMKDVLEHLKGEGCTVGIVSSKAKHLIQKVLEAEKLSVDFVQGGSGFFGKSKALKKVLKTAEVTESVYVGDELRDVEACQKVGLDMIGVGWGFNSEASLKKAGVPVASTPQELLYMLTRDGD